MPELTKLYMQKVQLPNETEYWVKDAAAWEVLESFFGTPTVGADGGYHFPEFQESSEGTIQEIIQEIINNQYITEINEAATYQVDETISSASTHQTLPTSKAVYDYVGSMIKKIPEFDVVVLQGDTPLPNASAYTFHKIYLKDASSPEKLNYYKEWITIRSGSEGAYTYTWELIGDTAMSLDGYAREDWVKGEIQKIEIAGVTVTLNETQQGDTVSYSISAADLKTALGLRALAYKDSAQGATSDQVFSGLKATGSLDATVTAASLSQTSTAATLTTTNFTPAGNVNVTLSTDTATFSGSANYTPTGDVTAEAGSATTVLDSATFKVDNNGVEIGGTNAASAVSYDAPTTATVVAGLSTGSAASFTSTYTAPAIETGFVATEGTAASFTSTYTAPTLTVANTTLPQEAIIASYQGADETLVFSNATTTVVGSASGWNAGSYTATFTPNEPTAIDTTKFSAGTYTATFVPNVPTSASGTESVVTGLGSFTAAAQVFTGNKYSVETSTKNVLASNASFAFSGNQATISVTGEYEKATGATAAFVASNTAAIITGVTYDKAEIGNITVTINNPELTVATFTVSGQTVTVS